MDCRAFFAALRRLAMTDTVLPSLRGAERRGNLSLSAENKEERKMGCRAVRLRLQLRRDKLLVMTEVRVMSLMKFLKHLFFIDSYLWLAL